MRFDRVLPKLGIYLFEIIAIQQRQEQKVRRQDSV
jgi:hypothetical protein